MIKVYIFVGMITFCVNSIHSMETNKIAYIFSPPRSISTACMRMMEAYGFTVFLEPARGVLEAQRLGESADSTVPKTFAEAKARILKASEKNSVCVKEMAATSEYFITEYKDLVSRPQVYCIFLLRDPHHAILSLYKRCRRVQIDSYSVGYQATYNIFKTIKQCAANKSIVILSEDLVNTPQATAEKICNYLKIPFKSTMLQWKDLGDDFFGKEEWCETKDRQDTHWWHGDAIKSSGIHQPSTYEVDAQGNPTFSEVDAVHRAAVIEAYQTNKIYYDLIKKESR